ncbi:hypothetical protein BC629DRAFT_1589477 [Irpex lacteus]|nr:hypothetical protein BC629DRAFT_1589477 [Irpex lacteus]
MRFSIITLLVAAITTANAAMLAERKEEVANPLACLSVGLSGQTFDILTCSAPTTCNVALTESFPLSLLPGINIGTLAFTFGLCSASA